MDLTRDLPPPLGPLPLLARVRPVQDLGDSQSTYQDVVLSLAVQHPELDDAQELAASAVLRFKGLQAEEEAWLARLTRRGEDTRIQDLAGEIRLLRDQLARALAHLDHADDCTVLLEGGEGPAPVEGFRHGALRRSFTEQRRRCHTLAARPIASSQTRTLNGF
jgi:hypothetical protein